MTWFKHDTTASQDSKIRKLILKYGAEGYAIYFHCLELIAGDVCETNITFELEHDSEIIADNLKIRGTPEESAIERVNAIMRYIIGLGLFEESGGRIFCFKLLKRMDTSMTSSPRFRALITRAKELNKEQVMISHDNVMQEQTRLEEKRKEKKKTESQKKPKKKRYGEHNNVLFTETEYNKLLEEWGEKELARMLGIFSEGLAMKSYVYKSHYLAIRRWRRNEKEHKGEGKLRRTIGASSEIGGEIPF